MSSAMKRAAIYLRVSTDGQTTDNQRHELETVLQRSGWTLVDVYEDHGVSGSKGRDKRPALDKLCKDAARRRFDVVMAWSVDRLGRIRYLGDDEEELATTLLRQWSADDTLDMFIVLIDTGVRLGELFRLEARDCHWQSRMVNVWQTKADKPRSIPMTRRVEATLRVRAGEGGRPTRKLFTCSEHGFRRIWEILRASMKLQDDPQFVPHCLRHTFASRLVQRGVDIRTVQQLLGHKTIAMTMRYAHLSPGNLHEAVAKLERPTAVAVR